MHEHEEEGNDNGDYAAYGRNGDSELMEGEVMAAEQRVFCYPHVLQSRIAHGHVGRIESWWTWLILLLRPRWWAHNSQREEGGSIGGVDCSTSRIRKQKSVETFS